MRRRGNAFLWNEKGTGKEGRAIFGKTGREGPALRERHPPPGDGAYTKREEA